MSFKTEISGLFSGRLLDRSGNPIARARFLEERIEWIYHLFTHFWSQHQQFLQCVCKSDQCLKVLVVDRHQKSRRIVCAYDAVTSMINQEELGPCRRGCPYTPMRKSQKHRSIEREVQVLISSSESLSSCIRRPPSAYMMVYLV